MTGHHHTADLSRCAADHPAMTSATALQALCVDAVRSAGLTPVGEVFHVFPPPGGVTGVVLLAESHLAVHTWPERGVVTLDVYVCNVSGDNSAAARQVVDVLIAAFSPGQVQRRYWLRSDGAPADGVQADGVASDGVAADTVGHPATPGDAAPAGNVSP